MRFSNSSTAGFQPFRTVSKPGSSTPVGIPNTELRLSSVDPGKVHAIKLLRVDKPARTVGREPLVTNEARDRLPAYPAPARVLRFRHQQRHRQRLATSVTSPVTTGSLPTPHGSGQIAPRGDAVNIG